MSYSKLVGTVSDLVRINSVNPNYPYGLPETKIQQFILQFFTSRGIQAWEQEVLPGRCNVIARLSGRDPSRRVVFEAHSDTAGVEDMVIPPFEPSIRNGYLYGRGSCDTKAGLAAMMHALADIQRSGVIPPGEVWVVATVDEEYAYRGVIKLSESLTALAAVVAEPTEMKMVVASKGCLRWRIVVRGKAAHSSKPHLGVNAIYQMREVLAALESEAARLENVFHPLVGSPTLNVGLIQGGTQANVVPALCSIEVDRRLIPGEKPHEVLASYQALLDKLGDADPEFDVTMETPLLQDWPLETLADSRIVLQIAQVLRKAGLDHQPAGVPFGSDASKLSHANIPSIILGPGSIDQAHTAEEYVELEQVEKAFVVYRQLMSTLE